MSTREMDENGDIWFFLADDSKKADEAQADSDVALSYADAKGMRFVSVAGTASVVHDRAKMEELYSPSLDIWFEKGLDTPGIALLRVTPVECEFWEPKHGKLVTAAAMLKSLVTKETPDDTMRDERVSRWPHDLATSPLSGDEPRDHVGDGTTSRAPVRRSHSSTWPSAAPRPTMTIHGTPTSSASPNFTPGETFGRSS